VKSPTSVSPPLCPGTPPFLGRAAFQAIHETSSRFELRMFLLTFIVFGPFLRYVFPFCSCPQAVLHIAGICSRSDWSTGHPGVFAMCLLLCPAKSFSLFPRS